MICLYTDTNPEPEYVVPSKATFEPTLKKFKADFVSSKIGFKRTRKPNANR